MNESTSCPILNAMILVRVAFTATLFLMFHAQSSMPSVSACTASTPSNSNTREAPSKSITTNEDPVSSELKIGGGAINEKQRLYGSNGKAKFEDAVGIQSQPGKTNFDPCNTPAHLLHALMGLERYPNYLSRWNYDLDDVHRLELALQEQMNKIRLQKDQIVNRNALICDIRHKAMATETSPLEDNAVTDANTKTRPKDDIFHVFQMPETWDQIRKHVLHPKASRAIFGSKQFRGTDREHKSSSSPPSVRDVLQGNVRVELDAEKLAEWLDEELFDVYSFPLLSKSFCRRLKKYFHALIEQSKIELETGIDVNGDERDVDIARRHKQLHEFGRRPIDLDSIGITWLNNLLFHLIIRPLSREIFATTEGFDDLDWRQGYIAGYSHKPSERRGAQRHRLVPHTDDSEVTLNVGMGDEDFTGGALAFWNLRGAREEGEYAGDFQPIMGHALLHSGRHLHEVEEVTGGDRFAMIVWARSWGSLRSTTCPCCWMTRREQQSDGGRGRGNVGRHRCIHKPHWN